MQSLDKPKGQQWFYRVQWSNYIEAEATWEREDDLKKEFPYLFDDQLESRERDSF